MSMCSKCEGKGFIEYEHGLLQVKCEDCKGTGEIDDSNSGARRDNQPTRKLHTGKPKQPKKPKARKKARKGSR